VKRIAKIILGCLAGLATLLILALVGINLYLQSSQIQTRIRTAAAQAIGSPVEIRRTLYTPWSGLTLSGIRVADPANSASNLMDANGLSVRFEFLPLLDHRFVIRQVVLNSPHFALRQSKAGVWMLPPPAIAMTTLPAAENTPRVQIPAQKPGAAAPPAPLHDSIATEPPFQIELQKFAIRNGNALFRDRKGLPLLQLSDISVEGDASPLGELTGTLEIGELVLSQSLYPKNLKATFKNANGILTIPDLTADLAKGQVIAQFQITTDPSPNPEFQLAGQLKEVSIPRLIEEASGAPSGSSGWINGTLTMHGNPADSKSMEGTGKLALNAARVEPFDFIRQIGELLRIDELQMLDLQQADMNFQIRDEHVWIQDMVLKTDNLIITAEGPVNFKGELDLDGRFLVNDKIQHQLGGLLSDDFTASEDAGYKQIAFDVTGRLSSPKTNLVERVTGFRLGNFGGFLKGLFQSPKKRKPEEHEPESKLRGHPCILDPEQRTPTSESANL